MASKRDPTSPPAATPPIPGGIQGLLRLAAQDPSFLDELVERRALAADRAGIALGPSERAILAVIPSTRLREMVSSLPRTLPRPRRERSHGAAATAVVLLGGAALSAVTAGCPPDDGAPTGSEGAESDAVPPPPPAVELEDLLLHEGGEALSPEGWGGTPERPRTSTLPAIGGVRSDVPEDCE